MGSWVLRVSLWFSSRMPCHDEQRIYESLRKLAVSVKNVCGEWLVRLELIWAVNIPMALSLTCCPAFQGSEKA